MRRSATFAAILAGGAVLAAASPAAAMYHPTLGRWVSRDPIGYDSASPRRAGLAGRERLRISATHTDLNLYHYVGSQTPSFVDPYGLSKCCGPDITEELADVLERATKHFVSLGSIKAKLEKCEGLTHPLSAPVAWDIPALYDHGWIKSYQMMRPPCAVGEGCEDSVQVNGKCYYAGSVNYVMFGHMWRLCDQTYREWYATRWSTILLLRLGLIDEAMPRSPDSTMYSEARMVRLIASYKGPYGIARLAAGTTKAADNFQASVDWARAGYQGWPNAGGQPASDRPDCGKCPHKATCAFGFRWLTAGEGVARIAEKMFGQDGS